MPFTDDEIKHGFCCAYVLHPDLKGDVAERITIDSLDWFRVKNKIENQKSIKDISFQTVIYSQSEIWERDQESLENKKLPVYYPTKFALLARYVKFLIFTTLEEQPVYAALAIGSQLYQYQPQQIANLSTKWIEDANLRRIKLHIKKRIIKRFCEIKPNNKSKKNWLNKIVSKLFVGKDIQMKPPTDFEKIVVNQLLARFSLQGIDHIPGNIDNILESYFADSPVPAKLQKHIIYDNACAGFPRLIQDYNKIHTKRGMKDAKDNMKVPSFENNEDGEHSSGNESGNDPFNNAPFSDERLSVIKKIVNDRDLRRTQYSGGPTRICIDGEEAIDYLKHFVHYKSLEISLTSKYLEIYGQDNESELLLGVIALPVLIDDRDRQKQDITIEYGNSQTIRFLTFPYLEADKVSKRIIDINYSNETGVIYIKYVEKAKPLFINILQRINPVKMYEEFAGPSQLSFSFPKIVFAIIVAAILLGIFYERHNDRFLTAEQSRNFEEMKKNNDRLRDVETKSNKIEQENKILKEQFAQLQLQMDFNQQELTRLQNQNSNLEITISQLKHPEKNASSEIANLIYRNQSSATKLIFPKELNNLNNTPQLMGSNNAGLKEFIQYSPVGTIVANNEPTFRWETVKGANSYQITIYDSSYNEIINSGKIETTKWKTTQPLINGMKYTWKVEAFDGNSMIGLTPMLPSPETKFMVISKKQAEKLNKDLQKVTSNYPEAHLQLGRIYAEAGLLDEAEEQFEALLKVTPDSEVAKELFRQVQSKRLKTIPKN